MENDSKKIIQIGLFLIPILAILFVFRNVIFFGGIFSNQDVIYNYLPYYLSILKGNFIEYAILGGFPVYTTMQATWFSPITRALLSVFSPANAYIFANISCVLLTYIFTYLFERKLKLAHEVAIISASTYLFAGQVMLWSHTPIIALYHFMLPASLYLYEVMKERRMWWGRGLLVVLLGIFLGYGWIGGNVQFSTYVHSFFALYVFFDLFVSNRSWKSFGNVLGLCAVVFGISFVIGLPQIAAIFAIQPYTFRADGVPISALYALGYAPYTFIQYILPSFRIYYPPTIQSFQNYIGILPLIILLAWYISLRKTFPKITDKRYKFFVGAFIFCSVIAIYKSPLAMLMHYVPFYNSFREAVRMMFMGDFALAMMLGYILQAVITHKVPGDVFEKTKIILKKTTLYSLLPGAALVTIFKLFFLGRVEEYLKGNFVAPSGDFPLEHYTSLIHSYLENDVTQLTFFSPYVIGVFVILGLIYWLLKKTGELKWQKFLGLAIVIIALDFSLVYFDRFPTIPKTELLTPGMTTKQIFEREKGNTSDYRYLSVFGDTVLWRESVRCNFTTENYWNLSPEEFELRKELIDPNFNIYSGLQSADGYEPYLAKHISDVSGYMGSRLASGPVLPAISSLQKISEKVNLLIERKNVLRSQNIKYVISPYEIKDVDFVLVSRNEVGKCKSQVFLYELTNPYPRFLLTKNVTNISESLEIMDAISKSTDPIVVMATSSDIKTNTLATKLDPTYKGNSIFLDIPPESSGMMLNIALTWLPGWHIKLDGRETEILRANYSGMAAYIPAGTKQVELYYQSGIRGWYTEHL